MELLTVPPIPPPLDQVGNRRFSFYPPIVGIEHNEWLFRKATWSEILVLNTKSNEELWMPRRFLGEVSRVDEPVVIVGLKKELEYKGGGLWPHERRVIEIPRAVNEGPRPAFGADSPKPVAPVVGIRLESGAESRIGRLMLGLILFLIVACVVVVSFFRGNADPTKVRYTAVMQSDLPFTNRDDFYSIKNKLGEPAGETWRSEQGEVQYQRLWYPQQGYYVILMGMDRKTAHYIGAMDRNWRVVHSVELPGGQSSGAMLKGLKQF